MLGTDPFGERLDPLRERQAAGRPIAIERPADLAALSRCQIAYLGDVSIYHLQTDDGFVLRVQETHAARSADPHYNWGDVLYLVWHARDAIVLTA